MNLRRCITAGVIGLCAQTAAAQTLEQRMASLESQIQSLQTELKRCQEEAKETARQQEMVQKVLNDAQARSGPGTQGSIAYKDGLCIAASKDFSLKLNSIIQPRYIYNHNDAPAADNDETGFAIRRAELYLTGTAFTPKLSYQLAGGFDRTDSDFTVVSAYTAYQFNDQWQGRVGLFKAPFMTEELVGAGRQQAVERSLVNALFSVGTTEGAQLQYAKNAWRGAVMVHDGTNAASTEFAQDNTDVGAAARVEWKLAGDWNQFADFQGWNDGALGVRLGAGIDYEAGESDSATELPDQFKYTTDLSIEGRGWNVFLAGVGRHAQSADPTVASDVDQYALMAQGGVFLIPNRLELFTRYEHIYLDGVMGTASAIENNLDVLTVGYNWFFIAHNAKLTTDLVYVFDAVPVGNTGIGMVPSSDGAQVILRVAFSFMF